MRTALTAAMISLFVLLFSVFSFAQTDPINRGDIDLNGTPYEFDDAVLLSNYFVYGDEVFTDKDKSSLNSDTNLDDKILGVGDFAVIAMISNGNMTPPLEPILPKNAVVIDKNGTFNIVDSLDIVAAWLTVRGDVSPVLLAEQMQLMYAYDSEFTEIFVYSLDNETFSGNFLQLPNGTEIISISMADTSGSEIEIDVQKPPKIVINGETPNPFSNVVTLSFTLTEPTTLHLVIYTEKGEEVFSEDLNADIGEFLYDWDASDFPPGVYLYKLDNTQLAPRKLYLEK